MSGGYLYGVQVRVYLDSVGAVTSSPRDYSLTLDGETCSYTGGLGDQKGVPCGVVGLDTSEGMSAHSASVEVLVGEVGSRLRKLVECQDALRIELNVGDGWEVVFDGFVSAVSCSETSTPQGFSWRLSLSAEGIHKIWNQYWMNASSVINAGDLAYLQKGGMALTTQITLLNGAGVPSAVIHMLLDYGVSTLMGLQVRGAPVALAQAGTPGFWQTGKEVAPRFWDDAFGLVTWAMLPTQIMKAAPLMSIIRGIIEPDLQEFFVTYRPSAADPSKKIPTLVFRQQPFPGAVGDDSNWLALAPDALVMGQGGAPGALSVSASKSDSRRANAYIWGSTTADDSSKEAIFSKTVVGIWSDKVSVERYGFAARCFTTSLGARNEKQYQSLWSSIIPHALARVAFQSHPLPCLWSHRRTYPLTPQARIGTPLLDATDGICGYIVQVSHRVNGTPTGFKAATTLSVDRVVEGVSDLAEYPDAVRAYCSTLVLGKFLPDSGVNTARGDAPAPVVPASASQAPAGQASATATPAPPGRDQRITPCALPIKGSGIGAPRKCGGHHQGVDFPMPVGTALLSPCNGTFTKNDPQVGGGNVARFVGVDGSVHAFAHLSVPPNLLPGAQLIAGVSSLGASGRSGNQCTGPHLHWQVFVKGQPVDPTVWLKGGNS